jgi:LmbE family N-acetylglucosaminyl deacetylase
VLHFDLLNRCREPKILLLGAHCDDIEIGCGATVMRLTERLPDASFVWITLCADDHREAETRAAAARLLAAAKSSSVHIERFRGSHLPYAGEPLKDYFDSLKVHAPDLILTHYRGDLHQDHRTVSDLTWNTFRDHAILEYEIPKFDGDLGSPNVFMPLTPEDVKRKCDLLMACYPSQQGHSWFTASTFEALARLRGIECAAPGGFAEAFYGRKLCLTL